MNSSKLLIILMALVAILAAFMYYLFANSKPKDISFVDKNATQELIMSEQNATNTPLDENLSKQSPTKQAVASRGQGARQGISMPAKNAKAQSAQGSLKGEFDALQSRAKRDTSLGEPRYKVYILDGKRMSGKEKEVINDIVRTLSERGGYLHYSLFVEKFSEGDFKIHIFNEDLLNNTKWRNGGLSLPHLWFKFNENTMQSIKNSFHIKNLKRDISGSRVRSLTLGGHTDELGGEFYNYALGLKRAAAVASEFLRITGKITLQSYGKQKPISQGHKEKERYKNRRVEAIFG